MRRERSVGRFCTTESSSTYVVPFRCRRESTADTLNVKQNIRTISKYYTRITVTRLSQLLDLTEPKTESFLSSLVSSKTVYAKIDRPAGIVSFKAPRSGDQVLNEWSSDVGKLMGLIEKSCHLIAKVSLNTARGACARSELTCQPLLPLQEHAVHAALKAQSLRA